MSSFNSVSEALDLLTDPFDDVGDWNEIIRRSGVTSERSRPRRRTVLAVALVALLALATAAFATGLADRFSSWLTGTPGTKAPVAAQQGFSARNAASFASFPRATKLRLLVQRRAGGTTFSLLGFRNGDTYCLRLVRADHPAAIGRNQCLRSAELHGLQALVVDDVWFSVGKPVENVIGVFGFAADDVRSMAVTYAHGQQTVGVADNVFLALGARPEGRVGRRPFPDTVLGVHALLRDGRRLNVPYTVAGLGIVPGGTRPMVPSYFAPSRASAPGPSRVTAPIRHPQIGWLQRRQPVGAPNPISRQHWFAFSFSRLIHPDPSDPTAFAIGVGTFTHQPPLFHPHPGPDVCLEIYQPLQRRAGGVACTPTPFANGPIWEGSWISDQVPAFAGLVADGISSITAYLSTGRTVTAALRDNVFIVSLPQVELPARLVAYTRTGQVAGIQNIPASPVAKACPTANFTRPIAQLPTAKPWERLDLAAMTIAGHRVLGETPAHVEAALGRPDRLDRNAERDNGVAIPRFFYGGTLPSTAGLTISFTRSGGHIYANTLTYQSPSLTETTLGHILRVQPSRLQRRILDAYTASYRLYLSYGSDPRLGCMAMLRSRGSRAGITLGLNPYRPSRPYLTLSTNGGG